MSPNLVGDQATKMERINIKILAVPRVEMDINVTQEIALAVAQPQPPATPCGSHLVLTSQLVLLGESTQNQ